MGDVVTAGQIVARLDPQNQKNALRSAQDNLASAKAVLTQAHVTFQRQQELLKRGWTPRDQVRRGAAGFGDGPGPGRQVRIAQDQLSYTTLIAD